MAAKELYAKICCVRAKSQVGTIAPRFGSDRGEASARITREESNVDLYELAHLGTYGSRRVSQGEGELHVGAAV